MMQARERVMEMLEKIIRERRNEINSQNNNHHEDFIQQLLVVDNDSSSSSPKLTDAEIKDNILTMIIAGPIYFVLYTLAYRRKIKILNPINCIFLNLI